MLAKKCTYAGCREVLTDGSYRCPTHAKKTAYRGFWDGFQRFYNSDRWKRARNAKLVMNPMCEMCKKQPAVMVDHIVELKDGGAETDLENLQSLCDPCHKLKTGREKRRRKREAAGGNRLSDF